MQHSSAPAIWPGRLSFKAPGCLVDVRSRGLMPDTPQRDGVYRLALSKAEAARALGVSVEFFDKHIAADVPSVQRGRRRLYAVAEIEGWLRREATAEPPSL